MLRIRFASEEDELDGYYLLATEARVKGFRGGLYEVTQQCLALLDQHSVKYVVISPFEISSDEAEAIENSPPV
jgi:hypothetical protein